MRGSSAQTAWAVFKANAAANLTARGRCVEMMAAEATVPTVVQRGPPAQEANVWAIFAGIWSAR